MQEEERKELLERAKTQPFNRIKLADKATRTGQAYVGGNQQEADKWFALAAEIRGKATDVVVSSKPVVEISHEEVAPVEEVEAVFVKDEAIEPETAKIYYCKKCEFSTPDKYILVGHYSSEHSWWHEKSESEAKNHAAIASLPKPITRKIYYEPEPRLGDFSMLVTIDDLAKLDDDEFGELWLLLGNVIRNRFVEEKSDIELIK